MINLFEYQNKQTFDGAYDDLEMFLDEIWKKREKSSYFDEELNIPEVQQFLQFIHKTNELKSNKYVGVIHFKDSKINLFPKIFYDSERDYSNEEVNAIQSHVLWWLSYCRKIKFPSYQTSLGSIKSDFFEVLVYLFSKYTRELLANSVYQQYEDVESELSFIKGRLNTSEYISENLAKGNWHKFNCAYDAFVIDNKFNRIIKYVATILFNATSSFDNKKYLREILFILDEVTDQRATAEECLNLKFNPLFGNFETVRDYCYLFLKNSISLEYKNNLKLFAFLLPMEYVFEDFIFGFIEKELKDITAKAQSAAKYLDEEELFSLRPDLLIEIGANRIIADTKYKIIYAENGDAKNGISQTDLYQMIAYGIRFKINEIKLFYPDTVKNYHEKDIEISIQDELAAEQIIKVLCCQLPIINREIFCNGNSGEMELSKLFLSTKEALKKRLLEILLPKLNIESYR